MSRATRPDLPLSIIDMVETLDEFHGPGTGLRVALKLMANFGGRDIKFPKVAVADHPVALALGMDDATILCQLFDGNQTYVPHGRRPRSQKAAVAALQMQGRDRAAIAVALGITERHVRRLANAEEPAPLPLFPQARTSGPG